VWDCGPRSSCSMNIKKTETVKDAKKFFVARSCLRWKQLLIKFCFNYDFMRPHHRSIWPWLDDISLIFLFHHIFFPYKLPVGALTCVSAKFVASIKSLNLRLEKKLKYETICFFFQSRKNIFGPGYCQLKGYKLVLLKKH
jgi:hypothetical protein